MPSKLPVYTSYIFSDSSLSTGPSPERLNQLFQSPEVAA